MNGKGLRVPFEDRAQGPQVKCPLTGRLAAKTVKELRSVRAKTHPGYGLAWSEPSRRA